MKSIKIVVKRIREQKREGMIQDLAPTLIVLVAMMILVYAFIGIFGMFVKYEDARQVGRQYVLRLESKGYLSGDVNGSVSGSDTKDLRDSLESLGLIVDDGFVFNTGSYIGGSETNRAGYGDVVTLKYTCDVPLWGITGVGEGGLFGTTFGTKTYPVTIAYSTTAKY